jgi:hypothetical protein
MLASKPSLALRRIRHLGLLSWTISYTRKQAYQAYIEALDANVPAHHFID